MGKNQIEKIEVHNVNVPGHVTNVDRGKYEDMKQAMLIVLPTESPGLNQTEMREAVVAHLDPELFPGGAKAAWWAKTVQLDMEAKNELVREPTKPLRWYRVV